MQTPPTKHTTPVPDPDATLDERIADMAIRRTALKDAIAASGVAVDSPLGIAYADLELGIEALAKAAAVGPLTDVQLAEQKRKDAKHDESLFGSQKPHSDPKRPDGKHSHG